MAQSKHCVKSALGLGLVVIFLVNVPTGQAVQEDAPAVETCPKAQVEHDN